MDYELISAFDDNNGYKYGIEWLDKDKILLATEWFKTEEERLEAIDRWYAEEQNQFETEQ